MNDTGIVFWYLDQTYLICNVKRLIDDDRIVFLTLCMMIRLNSRLKNCQARQKSQASSQQFGLVLFEFMPPSLTVQFFISWPALVVQ